MAQRESRGHLSQFDKGLIVGMKIGGIRTADVATRVQRDPVTVRRVWQRWQQQGTAKTQPRSGRPRILSPREDRHIVRLSAADPNIPAVRLRQLAAPQVSVDTVRNRLRAAGRHCRRPIGCPRLTPQQAAKRQSWCEERVGWTEEWKSVVFSDESRFSLEGADGRKRVWRTQEEGLRRQCLQPRRKGPSKGIMVWGAISYDAKSPLVIFRESMTSELYLAEAVLPHAIPFVRSVAGGIFQQDNAGPHTGRIVTEALAGIPVLPWPANSADLSIIEHVWDMIGRQVNDNPPRTVATLERQVKRIWNNLDQDAIRHLYDRLPARVEKCIEMQGWYTGY